MAQYRNHNSPGLVIPHDRIDKIDAAGDDKAKVADISIVIASNTVRELRDMTRGVHVMAIGWEDKIPAILDRAFA
jgi:5,10-methylenetetrahydrofolate reductase